MNLHESGQFDELPDLDRLVDGELSDVERRNLLGRLERQPDGWRRLALAFLEAQTWGDAARETDAVAASPKASEIRPAELVDAGSRNWKRLVGTPLAMAASFLLAFTLGIALRGAWRGTDPNAAMLAAQKSAQSEAAMRDVIAQAQLGPLNGTALNDNVEYLPVGPEFAATRQQANDPVEEVWLPTEESASDESNLAGTPAPAVPEQVLRSLRRLGHEVQTHQSLWPVDLKNGQRALVPVDEVEIRYVGNDYQ